MENKKLNSFSLRNYKTLNNPEDRKEMRIELKDLGDDERHTFTATFERIGHKMNSYTGYPEPTMLFTDIICDDKLVADHLWFNYISGFASLHLEQGDKVMFDARVSKYEKGYKGYKDDISILHPVRMDYHLSRPTKIKKLS